MSLKVTIDKVGSVLASVKALTGTQVMVGIPSTQAGRREGPINNAALGYIHENGAPEVGIPARPFLRPGVESVQERIIEGHKRAAELALQGKRDAVDRQFDRIGLIASTAVKKVIAAGIPPPLADSTLRARAARAGKGTGVSIAKGARRELARRAKGGKPGTDLAKPLYDTGQLVASITYVKRKV